MGTAALTAFLPSSTQLPSATSPESARVSTAIPTSAEPCACFHKNEGVLFMAALLSTAIGEGKKGPRHLAQERAFCPSPLTPRRLQTCIPQAKALTADVEWRGQGGVRLTYLADLGLCSTRKQLPHQALTSSPVSPQVNLAQASLPRPQFTYETLRLSQS